VVVPSRRARRVDANGRRATAHVTRSAQGGRGASDLKIRLAERVRRVAFI
jgi:hypothetical protein